jgi:predicted PurR-regulated permease PerM
MARPRHVTLIFVGVLMATSLLLARLLWVFLSAIVLALVLVSLFAPLNRRLAQVLGGRLRLASGLTTLGIVLGVVIPGGLFGMALTHQAWELYMANRQAPLLQEFLAFLSGESALALRFREAAAAFGLDFSPDKLGTLTTGLLTEVGLFLYERLSGMAADVLSIALHFGVMVLVVFTLLVDGHRLKSFLMDLSPLPEDEEEELVRRFQMISRAVFLGNGASAALQGVLGGLGFALFDLGSGVLWGAVMGFLSFLPIVGASAVFLPAAAVLALRGDTGLALGYLLYNFIYVGVVEYGLKPRFISGQGRMSTVLVFLGILGGLSLFGILGLFYGPLIISMFLALVGIYKEHYRVPAVAASPRDGDHRSAA